MLKREVRRDGAIAELDAEEFAQAVEPAEPVRRSLTVGRADDPSERVADQMADAALRNLGSYDEAGPSAIARQASMDDPLGGTEVDNDVQRKIDSKRGGGRALGERESTSFSDSYGVDLSGVRVHADSEADQLSRSLQADAFTTGNDIFFRQGKYQPGTSEGDRLIGHELAHVATESGGAARSIHRFMTPDSFATLTNEGMWTSKDKAQTTIEAMLAELDKLKVKSQIPDTNLAAAISKIDGMIRIAKAWKTDHEDENGKADANRAKRYAGFVQFIARAEQEIAVLKGRSSGAAEKAAAMPADARVTSLEEHHLGEGVTLFQRAGALLDSLLEKPGQSAEFKIELTIPVPPATVGGFLELSAERDEKGIEAKGTIAITGGGSVGVAELKGALGGYVAAKGANGAMVGSLMEYALYRRCAESNLIPWEAEAYLFGGSADERGKRRAEKRSLQTEQAAFGAGAGEDGDDFYAETGGMAELGVKAGISDALEIEGGVRGTSGKRTDRKSLEQGKGVGAKNKKADSWINTATLGSRGAQQSTGRSTAGFSAKAGVTVAGIGVEVEYQALWLAEKTTDGKTSNMKIESSEIELAVEDVPIEKLIGETGKEIVLKGIDEIQKQIDKAPDEQVDPIAEAQLDAAMDAAKSEAEDAAQAAIEEAGGEFQGSESLGFALGFDFIEKELAFKVTKTSGTKISIGVVEVEAKKKETLLEKTKSFKKEDAKQEAGGSKPESTKK
jgi:Domain of unknown function (DUF4157)